MGTDREKTDFRWYSFAGVGLRVGFQQVRDRGLKVVAETV